MVGFRSSFVALALLAVSSSAQQLSTGALLVATPDSQDPDFARSVVVLIHYDSDSAVGLILNKPTNSPISDVLPEAKGKSVTVYTCGPLTIGFAGYVGWTASQSQSEVARGLWKVQSADPTVVSIPTQKRSGHV
jgi:putative AlgH/UPF0301 family transcriptional regulator